MPQLNKQQFRHRSKDGTSCKMPIHYSQATHLSKPHIIGYMSVDGNRQYHPDLSQLKYLNQFPRGPVSLDLNHNIDSALKRTTDENDEKITLLLSFLLDQEPNLRQEINKPNFISYRRTLISIMCAAFETKDVVTVAATLFDGSIYLCSLETEIDMRKRKSRTKQAEKFCAWGYKFEQYLLSDFPNIPPNINRPVIENEEFSLYYSTTLGNKQLVYGAQIDGLLSTHEPKITIPLKTSNVSLNLEYLRKNEYVELKTNREIQNYKQNRNFKRYKLLRCWCQCYLANLKGLLVGYRTDDGIVKNLQWFDTEEIVRYCRDEWNPQTAINFLDHTLSYIQNSFQDENSVDLTTLQFEICGSGDFTVNKLQNDSILPNWYVEKINVLKA